jgi:outer membrane protein
MRFFEHFRASLTRPAIAGAAVVFASVIPLSASGQSQQPQAGTPLTMEDAVRMALENNLGIQAEKLNPEIEEYALERAEGVYAPALISSLSRSSSASPPTDFLSSGVGVVTNGNFVTQAGVQQQLRFGGGYQVTWDGSRSTSDAPRTVFSPRLGSNMTALITQPLLRNFRIDAARQQILQTRTQQKITDIQLRQRITQTSRNVRAAYYNLIGAISGLTVAQQSLEVAQRSLRDNQRRLEVGTIPQIDLVSSEAEVASNEEAVIVQQAAIESAQDQLRTLIMNPSQPGFWTATFRPTDPPELTRRTIDLDAAVKNALENRTDIEQFKRQMEATDISLRYAANQKLPGVDLQARYGVTGIGGTQFQYGDSLSPTPTGSSIRTFSDVLRDVFGNNFRTWSFAVNFSYPLGTSQADAAYAQAKVTRAQEQTSLKDLEMSVTTSVREAARQVNTNLKRVEATRKARELAERRLDAEQKRFDVGLSTTFELFQAQRDLSRARQSELTARIDYSRSLVDFEAVQHAPLGGGGLVRSGGQ